MLLIGNGAVITRNSKGLYLQNGAICTEGNKIIEVGGCEELKSKYPQAEWVDAHGGFIMPGLINTHNHIYSAFARGLSIPNNHPRNFQEILKNTWWDIDSKLTIDQTYNSAMATYIESIKNGVTCVFDHHASFSAIKGSLQAIEAAARETGIRTCLSFEISDRCGVAAMKASVKENIDTASRLAKNPEDCVTSMIGMHASFTLSDETLAYVASQNTSKVGYHIHVSEGIYDEEHCQENYGMSVVERLHKWNILGNHSIAGHCVNISESDMEILKNTDTMVVHNPESNMGNAVGVPKVLEMYEKGILIGLGSDGYTNDMLESLKVANLIHKHETRNPGAGWDEMPVICYEHNRKIANRFFENETGILKAGSYADIIVMEYYPITPMNENNYNSHILFGMSGKNTITTIINGVICMKDRKIMLLEEEEVLKRSQESAAELWKKYGI